MVEANLSSPRVMLDTPREADDPRDSAVARFGADKPLKLDAGVELSPFQIAYKTYGTLKTFGGTAFTATGLVTANGPSRNSYS